MIPYLDLAANRANWANHLETRKRDNYMLVSGKCVPIVTYCLEADGTNPIKCKTCQTGFTKIAGALATDADTCAKCE